MEVECPASSEAWVTRSVVVRIGDQDHLITRLDAEVGAHPRGGARVAPAMAGALRLEHVAGLVQRAHLGCEAYLTPGSVRRSGIGGVSAQPS